MYLQAKGQYSKQAHVQLPDGTYEEEFGRDGFYGPVTELYHRQCPTGWTRIEGPLRPRAFNTRQLSESQAFHPIPDRITMLYNDDVALHIARPTTTPDWYFRNADGDELVFVHQGTGTVETDFGPLLFEPGDYIVLPRGITYRFCPSTPQNCLVVIEATGRLTQPPRGLLGQHALYDQTVLQTPTPAAMPSTQPEYEVRVKRLNQLTSVFYPYHPLDVVGWKGDLYPFTLNIQHLCPVMSHKAHLPPSVHTTFLAPGFVVCTFLPRPMESAPGAMRVPFYHRNIDYDEVLFYHAGDFFSRDGIDAGMITLHPQGIHHGPHPKALDASWQKTETNEMAVMLDTQRPLYVTPEAEACEWQAYWQSWQDNASPLKA